MSGNLPIIIGVDPGSICGWVVLIPGLKDERYYLWRYGQTYPTMTRWVHALLSNIQEKYEDRQIVIVIEAQYLPKGYNGKSKFKMSQKAVIGLILNRARWQIIAELLDIEVIPVSPLKWQSALLGASNKIKSEERKKRAKRFVEEYFDIKGIDEHEADAICVATHEARLSLTPISQKPRPDKGERFRAKKKAKPKKVS